MTEAERPIPAVVAQILEKRGIVGEAATNFIYPSYDDHLHDPFLLTDMELAVARIQAAIDGRERVVIYGDYDIDGITASAILYDAFRDLGLDVHTYIPDRFEEGYGLNSEALTKLKEKGAQLVVTVDCGITSVNEAAWARENGLDLIITDHHSVPPGLPEAVAVVNPKRPYDAYPFKDLCGAGVAFKLVQAMAARLGRPKLGQEKWLLDLVALGTICDIVPLVGENRVLVSYGLKVLQKSRRAGLRALAAVGGIELARIDSEQVGFVLGPRMNAAGRLEHAARSLELILTRDEARALEIAEELNELNLKRRADQAKIVAEASMQAEAYAAEPVLVLAHEDWSHGVVGIAASKLVDRFKKPVLVGQIMGDTTKGSARSLGDFNMIEALRSCDELFLRYGGHVYAAGFTIHTADLPKLRYALTNYYLTSGIDTTASIRPEPEAELVGLREANWELLSSLELMQPHGAANKPPLLALRNVIVESLSAIGRDGSHLRARLRDSGGVNLGAVGFGLAERYRDLLPGMNVTVLGFLNKNEYQGNSSLQLTIAEFINE